jgi:hypothetical protein
MAKTAEIVTGYLAALASQDFDRAAALISEDYSFRGPMDFKTEGRRAFLREATGAYTFARGVRILRQWEDANEICSIYELKVETPTAATSMLMTEWDTVRDGRLVSSLLVFDTSAHDTLMPEGHSR